MLHDSDALPEEAPAVTLDVPADAGEADAVQEWVWRDAEQAGGVAVTDADGQAPLPDMQTWPLGEEGCVITLPPLWCEEIASAEVRGVIAQLLFAAPCSAQPGS